MRTGGEARDHTEVNPLNAPTGRDEAAGPDPPADRFAAAVNTDRGRWGYVFGEKTRRRLHDLLDFDEGSIPERNSEESLIERIRGANIVLSTWGAVPYTAPVLDACPDLRLVLYAAGSVKYFVTPELTSRGITVSSAVHLNARPVAEFVLGIILTSLKNVFSLNDALTRGAGGAWHGFDRENFGGGYYGTRVGLIGFGRVSRELLRLLRNFQFDVVINDPYLTSAEADSCGARLVTLEELLSTSDVVSLHHADIPANWNMIDRHALSLMKSGARFVNTSRGRLVNEDDLVEELRTGRITAFLDVTHPEPPPEGHPFYTLPNCILTPHIAGSIGSEVRRMGDFALAELERWSAGARLEGAVDLSRLESIA